MNVPGVPNGNWAFRVTRDQLDGIDFDWVKTLNKVYWRAKPEPKVEEEETAEETAAEDSE